MTALSHRDSLELAAHVRRQATLAKSMVAVRAAELLADFEEQVSRVYSFDEEVTWREAMATVDAAIAQARVAIRERCDEMGIPPEFQPTIGHGWYGRRENAIASRRAELRKAAERRIDALGKAAKVEIERGSIGVQTALLSGRLGSDEARAFLEAMPTADALMPLLDVAEVQKQIAGPS